MLRIHTLKNADVYENIQEFDQTIESWSNATEKMKADNFFLKLCSDYHLNIHQNIIKQKISLLSEDSLYLEIQNPLIPNRKIEIPVINFQMKNQQMEVQSTLIYFKNFHIEDFTKRKKQIIGKILVIELEQTDFYTYIEASKRSGILGLILIIKNGNSVPCYQYTGNYKIPILGLSQDDGFFLLESLQKYPQQFIRIIIKQKTQYQNVKIWKWEKNYGKSKNLYVLCTWRANSCSKALLSSVIPAFLLLDLAKAFQNFEWNSHYNLIFLWSDQQDLKIPLSSNDYCIQLNYLTDFMGWYYPKEQKKIWTIIENYLTIYDTNLTFKPSNTNCTIPIIPLEHQKIMNTDSENLEWIHKDMLLRTLGMTALTIYLLSIK